jgi:hypothetical protein
MQATVTIEVPPGTDVVLLLALLVQRAGPQRKEAAPPAARVQLVLVPPPEPPPVGAHGPQLPLPYPGVECDVLQGCRMLDF